MADRKTWTPSRALSEWEKREAAVLNATNVSDLKISYRSLLDSRISSSNLGKMLEQASPASLVELVLKGYEIPDSRARQASNHLILKISEQMDELRLSDSTVEQFWLIIAGQRDILLERLESDIEATFETQLEQEKLDNLKSSLYGVHKLIRKETDAAVEKMFSPVSQAEIPFAAS